jgi:hypothetical protein
MNTSLVEDECEQFYFDSKVTRVGVDVVAWYVFIIDSLGHASTADMQMPEYKFGIRESVVGLI